MRHTPTVRGYRMKDWAIGTRRRGKWDLSARYRLDGLSAQSERELLGHPGPPLVPLSLLVLRHAGTEKLTQRLPYWRELFARVYSSANGPWGLAEGEAMGEAKGLVKAVLQVLDARGVRVDDASRYRIQGCMDVATLERWHKRALTATRISEVLDGPTQ
jgi:hypothetical protein